MKMKLYLGLRDCGVALYSLRGSGC